jgi:hypothetical protein
MAATTFGGPGYYYLVDVQAGVTRIIWDDQSAPTHSEILNGGWMISHVRIHRVKFI